MRVSLAHSMHQMAAIVGADSTETDLLPVFDAFRDDVDAVREGLLKHLAAFYKVVLADQQHSRPQFFH